jgi:hypothetical protein
MLALALARPVFSLVGSGSSGRDAVDAVFVIDTSYSMGAREGAKTRFELAQAAAVRAIDQLPPHSTVQIFSCGTTSSVQLVREPSNLDLARKVIEELELTHEATDLGGALAKAAKALDDSRAANKELYVISDMQKEGLTQNAGQVNTWLSHAKSAATIYFVRTGTRTPANAAIVEVVPQSGIPRPGHRIGFAVVVKNTASISLSQLQVGLAVDGMQDNAEMQTIPVLPAGDTRVVALTARFDKPGPRIVTAFLTGDDLPGDNYLDRVVEVRDKVKVLVVDGNLNLREPERSSSFFLVNALAPAPEEKQSDYYLQADVIGPRQAGGELLKDKAVCILANVPMADDADAPTMEFLDALNGYVHKGGSLLIYGGDNVSFAAYNKVLGSLLPVPLGEAVAFPLDKPVSLDRKSVALPDFDHLRTDTYFEKLSVFPIVKTVSQEEPGRSAKGQASAARVVIRYSNGQPAIVTRKVGAGEVMFVGTSADPGYKAGSRDPTWNWLPLWGHGFVPLVEAKLNFFLRSQSQSHNGVAGEQLHHVPSADKEQKSFVLVPPGDRTPGKGPLLPEAARLPLGLPQKDNDRSLVVSPALSRAGVYWLTTRDGESVDRIPFAVAADVRESADLQTMSDADIDRQLGFAPIHLTVREEESVQFAAERTNREWTNTLLWLVLAMALGETLLAWYCGRPLPAKPLAA